MTKISWCRKQKNGIVKNDSYKSKFAGEGDDLYEGKY